MGSMTLQVLLRVLYTVNSNPQYILAKSSSQVPAIRCSEATTQPSENDPSYARTPLKACLAVVCDSSPELLQDSTRDFSLYVLDPLEAQPLPMRLAHAPQNTNSPRGVAVALGLMSWALESNDSHNVFVTGTIIPSASLALEVVFALRETKRMPKPMLHMYPSLGPMSVPGTSQHPPQAAGMNWLYSSHQQERQTLTRSADFPELYIGPPRRARGRPEGSISSKSKTTSQADDFSLSGAGSSKAIENHNQEARPRSKTKTKPRASRAPPAHSPFIRAPLARQSATERLEKQEAGVTTHHQQSHRFSQNQIHPQTQPNSHRTHNTLLGLLSAIPSASSGNITTATQQQAALLSVLQGLLATNPQLLQLAATNTGLPAGGEQTTEGGESKADDRGDDGDSDIVVLDSSTVDTTAFHKRDSVQLAASDHGTTSYATNQESPMSSQGTDSSLLPASTPPSRLQNAPSSQTSAQTVGSGRETPTSKHVSSEQMERGNTTTSYTSNIPAPSTPSRARKRKLGEYIHGQVHPSTPTSSPPSPPPSPSMVHMSRSGRVPATRQVQSSPTGGMRSTSLSLARLPSMLGSMRTTAASGSRLQSTTLVSGPPRSKEGHPGISDASLNDIVSDTTTSKRRRTLSEFMAEHEARKSAKGRKRSSSGHKLEVDVSTNAAQAPAPTRSTKVASTSKQAQSSPPRPLVRSDSVVSSLLTSNGRPGLAPGAAISRHAWSAAPAPATASSTALGTSSTAALTKNPLKNFVLPAWARTSTAMLPRLSEEVLARQRAEQEAKKAQVSLRRREAAKAKRKRLHGAERPSKESSEEDDDDTAASDVRPRTVHPSSSGAAQIGHLPPLPLAALPVFASDAVEPIPPSSPPPSHRLPVPPSTPPRKPASPGSAPPGKSGSCSLFTPSGQDVASLFTPTTPSVARSLTRAAFTPRSPTVLHRSGTRISPRKSMPQTPKRNSSHHQTPRSFRAGRIGQFVSPSLAMHTPQVQTQTGMGIRAFLLPPPSPCAARSPYTQKRVQMHARVSGNSTPALVGPENSGIAKPDSPSEKRDVEGDKGKGRQGDALPGEDMSIPPAQGSPTHPAVDEGQGTSEPCDTPSNGDAFETEMEYASSPLPPSSPLPTTPFSSPVRHQHNSNLDTPTTDDPVVPDTDILFPTTTDSDGPLGTATLLPLLSNDGTDPTAWFTDSETSAWLTETEAWLTDTEGGARLTDSDGAWLSDSDAVFGDMSSLPPSAASNWLSDDVDVDTDGDFGTAIESGGFDAAAFEKAFAAFVECAGRDADNDGARSVDADGVASGSGGGSSTGVTQRQSTKGISSEFWDSVRPLLGLDEDAGTGGSIARDKEGKATQAIQESWDGLASTG